MALSPRQEALIADFAIIEDAQERLGAIVDRARRRPPLPDVARTEETRVKGCQSQVWVIAETKGGTLQFAGDSDSPLVRGLVVLTCDFFSGDPVPQSGSDNQDLDPITLLDLSRNLSPTRQNGLAAVRARIRQLARTTG